MKTFLLLLALASSVSAQNFAVQWTGSNTNGTPEFWPIILHPVGTNTVFAGAIVLTSAQLDRVIQTNTAAFQTGRQVIETALKDRARSYIAALEVSMQQAADCVALIDGGTLNTAQRNAEFTRLKGYLADIRSRVRKILAVSNTLLDNNYD